MTFLLSAAWFFQPFFKDFQKLSLRLRGAEANQAVTGAKSRGTHINIIYRKNIYTCIYIDKILYYLGGVIYG